MINGSLDVIENMLNHCLITKVHLSSTGADDQILIKDLLKKFNTLALDECFKYFDEIQGMVRKISESESFQDYNDRMHSLMHFDKSNCRVLYDFISLFGIFGFSVVGRLVPLFRNGYGIQESNSGVANSPGLVF